MTELQGYKENCILEELWYHTICEYNDIIELQQK